MADVKTHMDYISIIGETTATGRSYREKRWNRYYEKAYRRAVSKLLGPSPGKVALDVGTSHGNWFNFLEGQGFNTVYGVELDSERAEQARRCGYEEVYNTDAASVPLPDASIDCAVSNDVFVHILQLADKAAVVKEVERVLKPGGLFIVNHTMSRAHGFEGYHVLNHCSFLGLDDFVNLVRENTSLTIEGQEPTYYSQCGGDRGRLSAAVRRLIVLPGAVSILSCLDLVKARLLPLEMSDTVYLKLRK